MLLGLFRQIRLIIAFSPSIQRKPNAITPHATIRLFCCLSWPRWWRRKRHHRNKRRRSPSRADILRGEYGRYRANNDLLSYHLDIRVDPEKKFLSGKNTIRFKMLKDDTRIQLDLHDNLKIDEIVFEPGASPESAPEPSTTLTI